MFQCGPYTLDIVSAGLNSTAGEILAISEFQKFEVLCLNGGKFEKDELDAVMDFDREDQDLDIVTGKIPEDYYHPNVSLNTLVNHILDSDGNLQTKLLLGGAHFQTPLKFENFSSFSPVLF